MAGGYVHNPDGLDGVVRLLRQLQAQIDSIRGGAGIKSAILRGDEIQFQDANGDLNVLIGNGRSEFYNAGVVSALLGEFPGFYWDVDDEAWHSDTVRGLALFRPNEQFPYFTAGHSQGANRTDITAGYDDVAAIESIDIQALHFAVRTAMNGARISINPAASGNIIIEADTSSDDVFIGNSESGVTISPHPSATFRLFNLGTTSNPANLNSTSNVVRVVTSARKYKTDITDAVVDPADVLELQPRTWIDKADLARYEKELVEGVVPAYGSYEEAAAAEAEAADEVSAGRASPLVAAEPVPPARSIGFVAEEVAVHESLQQLVQFNPDGTPEAIYYDRMCVALVELAKAQQTQINDLTERIERLEGAA